MSGRRDQKGAKAGKAKGTRKRSAIRDLSPKKTGAVKGGNVSLNFAKVEYKY